MESLIKQKYQCKECGLGYKDKTWAIKCEKWCKKYNSCNLAIAKNAIK
jgi:predicted ATP-dependent serine protease